MSLKKENKANKIIDDLNKRNENWQIIGGLLNDLSDQLNLNDIEFNTLKEDIEKLPDLNEYVKTENLPDMTDYLEVENALETLGLNLSDYVSKESFIQIVQSEVPKDAAFTDTTYSRVTSSFDGLMSAKDKEKLDGISHEDGYEIIHPEVVLGWISREGYPTTDADPDWWEGIVTYIPVSLGDIIELSGDTEDSFLIRVSQHNNAQWTIEHNHDLWTSYPVTITNPETVFIAISIRYEDQRAVWYEDLPKFEDALRIKRPEKPLVKTIPITIDVDSEIGSLSPETGKHELAWIEIDENNFEINRRTGRYLKVLPDTSLGLIFNDGTAFIYEYIYTGAGDILFEKRTEAISNESIVLGTQTNLLKIEFNGLSNPLPHVQLKYQTLNGEMETMKNVDDLNLGSGSSINNIHNSFVYEVFESGGRDIMSLDGSEKDFTEERYFNAGLLILPPNYTPIGKATRLIVFCHESSDYLGMNAETFAEQYGQEIEYLRDEGYAILSVYDWTTKYNIEMQSSNFGSPIAFSALTHGYKWVLDNYNIRPDGLFVTGKSSGGSIGLGVHSATALPVLATGMLAAGVTPFTEPYSYELEAKQAFADDFGFVGDYSVLSHERESEELKEFIRQNTETMQGYNAMFNGLIGVPLNVLSEWGAEKIDIDPLNYEGVARVGAPPTKLWASIDDPTGVWTVGKIYTDTIKNAGGFAELRTLPDKTGGHYATDIHENALRVERVETATGIVHQNVALAYVELVQFFKQFDF